MDVTREGQDRRLAPRYTLARRLRVRDMLTGQVVGSIVNVAASGFMLMSKSPLEPDERLLLLLELPEEAAASRSVRVEARCLWCAPSSFSSDYGAGFEITQIARDDQLRLQRWLNGVTATC